MKGAIKFWLVMLISILAYIAYTYSAYFYNFLILIGAIWVMFSTATVIILWFAEDLDHPNDWVNGSYSDELPYWLLRTNPLYYVIWGLYLFNDFLNKYF
jgi:hypothetical protein